MAGFTSRLKTSFNVLLGREDRIELPLDDVIDSSGMLLNRIWKDSSDKVLAPIITKLSMDAVTVPIRHVRVDKWGRYQDTISGELNERFNLQANTDQSGFAFIQDVVTTMLQEGVVAVVPIDITANPKNTTSYDILSLRVGVVVHWYNKSVKVEVYDENTGQRRQIILPKSYVALCYNPMYSVMNEPNSTLKRLIDKLALMDLSDAKASSPNLDIILQLPYAVRGKKLGEEANRRLRLLEEQLAVSSYGAAYIDSTEKITQLNRPVSNNLHDQVEYLYKTLYDQLGLTQSIMSGTATPQELVAYHNRTIEPILNAITSAMKMSFLTLTAVRQGQSIMSFPNLFKMAPIGEMADSMDKFGRNEILSPNESRSLLGLEPKTDDPEANELRNRNLNKQVENSDNNNSGDVNEGQSEEKPV